MPASRRVLLLAALFLCGHGTEARADFLITPFIGTEFGGSTTLLDLDIGATSAKHWTFGGNVAWLSDGVFGVEADFSMVPGFFQNSNAGLVTASRVTTLTGNLIATLPVSVTQESLRPYVVGGLGLLHATTDDLFSLNGSGGDWLGLQLGAGAIGFVTNRAGVRFDLRHVSALSRDTTLRGERTSKLSFWRATVGVTLRY